MKTAKREMEIEQLLKRVTGIADNSENVREGFAFFALSGSQNDGLDYIEHAIKNGAKFVILDQNATLPKKYDGAVEFIKVDNPRSYISLASSIFYKEKPQYIVAVTGTNGKTSVANFFQQICDLTGYKSASIGTLGVITSEQQYEAKDQPSLTSPCAIELHEILHNLSNSSYTHASIEASSHGLRQHRLDHVNFQAAGFTNLTQDHLDYHGTMEEYFAAKLRLFDEVLKPGSYAVLNADTNEFQRMKDICNSRSIKVLDYGKKAKELQIVSSSGVLEVQVFGQKYKLQPTVKGEFQLYNILCSTGLAAACELPVNKILDALNDLKAAKGRLELVAKHNGADVYVDYAHTPDSLQTILTTLRQICKGELHVLFGCGGNRDATKRPIMGEIASRCADHIIITDDNPRKEHSDAIRKEIMAACNNGVEIEGRANAIEYAMSHLKENDILVIAGKGHENYQLIGNSQTYFSDFDEVLKISTRGSSKLA
ncbi:UDP-N-acetylmuramoyl-L-alanyl-D-glutamate--2,6-diaminopimelate ligase [Candidatus Bandiella euplotis]|uniref:UDP-N-acetylmuramoyl-L-alanyl-D-glutamate--2, 6-diaminopimelate ligase n=1 Tax=Candidatus Bandiella euplotis TaxID=1664265 RepID=UPI002B25757D|nr:UDP-N-acetylmuramoyl-L-alanyl-D-glutamate--2,6-diaminopimelate ligase [Candidatus Bandiella woodruffii]